MEATSPSGIHQRSVRKRMRFHDLSPEGYKTTGNYVPDYLAQCVVDRLDHSDRLCLRTVAALGLRRAWACWTLRLHGSMKLDYEDVMSLRLTWAKPIVKVFVYSSAAGDGSGLDLC